MAVVVDESITVAVLPESTWMLAVAPPPGDSSRNAVTRMCDAVPVPEDQLPVVLPESWAVMVKVKVPAAVGVPLSTPPLVRVSPVGKVPVLLNV